MFRLPISAESLLSPAELNAEKQKTTVIGTRLKLQQQIINK